MSYGKIISTYLGQLGEAIRNLILPNRISSFITARRAWLRTAVAFLSHTIVRANTVSYAAAALVFAAFVYFPFFTSRFSWLPELTEAQLLLGTLLTAQAAIAALTLAVTLFVMNGASARRDTDDRVYHEYIRRSWVREIFWSSLFAVFVSALVLVVESTVSATAKEEHAPGLENLAIVAGIAFLTNLFLAAVLFEKAIALSRPQNWWAMRRAVNERDVREAVQAFVLRARRAAAAAIEGQPDVTVLFPSSVEGSANQAILALLDEGRRALADRRLGEFKQAFDSIKELIRYAMGEIQTNGIGWGRPGLQPEWPPLRELGRNLYSFREEVIRRGDRDFVFELLSFDYWLVLTGRKQDCGELYTVGVNGYRWNYQISLRIGDREFQELFRERLWGELPFVLSSVDPSEDFPFALEAVRNQEGFLDDAMQTNNPSSFALLHRVFENALQIICRHWIEAGNQSAVGALCNQLTQAYRIALMGLAGRAVLLEEAGNLPEATPYLETIRTAHSTVGQLAGDMARAFEREDSAIYSLWSRWDMEGSLAFAVRTIYPQKYPLAWFSIRLMEFVSDDMDTPACNGQAQQIQKWFEENVEMIEKYVRDMPELGLEKRRELASNALLAAIRRDVVEEEYEIIQRELSEHKVSTFVSGVNEAAIPRYTIERAFEVAKAFNHLPSDAEDLPDERGYRVLVLKGPFAEEPSNARIAYGSWEGRDYGRGLANDVIEQFVAALEVSPQNTDSLATAKDLLAKLDELIQDLQPSGSLVIVLAGNWSDVEVELAVNEPAGFELQWRVPEDELTGDIGRYQGFPVFRRRSFAPRELYVVDLEAWGQMVRGEYEDGRDIFVRVSPISGERAQELLEGNPNHFTDEPDEASKLRKLQTHVELTIYARFEFKVLDALRARRVVGASQSSC